jgi:hypothetical protein
LTILGFPLAQETEFISALANIITFEVAIAKLKMKDKKQIYRIDILLL